MGDDGRTQERRSRNASLARTLDHLDLLGDLDDIGAGGVDGAGAAVEIGVDALLTGPDDALDALDGVTDLADAFDDLL